MTLKELRLSRKNHLTVEQVADEIKISRQHMYKHERDPKKLSLGTMEILAGLYNVSVSTVAAAGIQTLKESEVTKCGK